MRPEQRHDYLFTSDKSRRRPGVLVGGRRLAPRAALHEARFPQQPVDRLLASSLVLSLLGDNLPKSS